MLATLDAAGGTATYRAVFDRLKGWMQGEMPLQTPQLEGDADVALFSGRAVTQKPYVRVVGAEEDSLLRLAGGSLVGLLPGTRLAVHPGGTAEPTAGTQVAQGAVARATEVAALVRLEGGVSPARAAASWGFVTEYAFAELRVRVRLHPAIPPAQRQALAAAFGRSGVIQIADSLGELMIRPVGAATRAGLALLLVACLPPAVVVAMQRTGALEGLADAKQVMPFLLARVAASVGPGAYTVILATLGLAALGSDAAIVRAMTAALAAVAPRALPSPHRLLPVVALAIGALLAARGQGIIDTMVSVNVVYIASVAVPFVALLGRRGIPASCVPLAMLAGFVAASVAYLAGWWGWIDARIDAVSLFSGLAASLLATVGAMIRDRRRLPIVAAPNA